ncbi:MAG: endo alpha-1,4 polygalactosaminidase [Myxococcota bacterium]
MMRSTGHSAIAAITAALTVALATACTPDKPMELANIAHVNDNDEPVLYEASLYPTELIAEVGSHSDQPLDVLAIVEQSGGDNDWATYREFYGHGSGYRGVFTFQLPAGTNAENLLSLRIESNFLGPEHAYQPWLWQLRDFTSDSWVTVGDNSGGAIWQWSYFDFPVAGAPGRFVAGDGRLELRYHSGNSADNSDLDYLAVTVTSTVALAEPRPYPEPVPAEVWSPAPGTSWQWQLQGALDTSFEVDMYSIDLFDTDSATIAQLRSAGRAVICYFSAGSWEDWRPDADQFPAEVKGHGNGWPGEAWLDIRQLDVLGPIMGARLDLAAAKGCDGVEPDNVDGYQGDTGFALSAADQLTYNIWLANQAHLRGLSVGLKNDLAQVAQLEPYFDWALNEQCFYFDECPLLLPFVEAGKAVFGVEYSGSLESFCPQANAMNLDWLKKRHEVDAWRQSCQ